MDPLVCVGSADMLEVARMGLHVAQLTSAAQMRACFDAVTLVPRTSRAGRLRSRGRLPADCVLLQARFAVEAIRLRAQRWPWCAQGA